MYCVVAVDGDVVVFFAIGWFVWGGGRFGDDDGGGAGSNGEIVIASVDCDQ